MSVVSIALFLSELNKMDQKSMFCAIFTKKLHVENLVDKLAKQNSNEKIQHCSFIFSGRSNTPTLKMLTYFE